MTSVEETNCTVRKDKIFNVRKLPFRPQDLSKSVLRPRVAGKENVLNQDSPKMGNEYMYQVAIVSSPAYRDLYKRFLRLRMEENLTRNQQQQEFTTKAEELQECINERKRLEQENERLLDRRNELHDKIEQLRAYREQTMAISQGEEGQKNLEYLREMVMAVRYQNGLQIDTDNMTYEQLLELEEQIGSVSRGLTQSKIEALPKVVLQTDSEDTCSVCCSAATAGETVIELSCKHTFHAECIVEWLKKEKVCPMCKQEVTSE